MKCFESKAVFGARHATTHYFFKDIYNLFLNSLPLFLKPFEFPCYFQMNCSHKSLNLLFLIADYFFLHKSDQFFHGAATFFSQFFALFSKIVKKLLVLLTEMGDLFEEGVSVEETTLIPGTFIYLRRGLLFSTKDSSLF